MNAKWEYEIMPLSKGGITVTLEELTKKGKQGWELVSIFQPSKSENFYHDKEIQSFAIFRRQVE